ncbi:hypothetical protein [Thetidibacter halocola]|uniref:Uncharacterized protein n=1 Tax=Thetidibacter halocola TaxID=2827239 RepID=A0A8J7WFF0_9RHOB|nr:hypothetical protein [Thetidibacter halocola]MBS0124343.1 hypothetical protein [Thetidibacter halocola]
MGNTVAVGSVDFGTDGALGSHRGGGLADALILGATAGDPDCHHDIPIQRNYELAIPCLNAFAAVHNAQEDGRIDNQDLRDLFVTVQQQAEVGLTNPGSLTSMQDILGGSAVDGVRPGSVHRFRRRGEAADLQRDRCRARPLFAGHVDGLIAQGRETLSANTGLAEPERDPLAGDHHLHRRPRGRAGEGRGRLLERDPAISPNARSPAGSNGSKVMAAGSSVLPPTSAVGGPSLRCRAGRAARDVPDLDRRFRPIRPGPDSQSRACPVRL